MGLEIERKFLIRTDEWKQLSLASPPKEITQGYLSLEPTVRVRIVDLQGYLTIKGTRVEYTCTEFEYPIPIGEATEMMSLSVTPLVEKVRHVLIDQHDQWWEIDVFAGHLSGLVMAEIEMSSQDQPIYVPSWIGCEVSLDTRFTNVSLARFTGDPKTLYPS